MKVTALIMAGGKGERFWPRSRVSKPKQFLSFTDDGKTMIQHTVDRIRPLVDIEDIYIVTNDIYKEITIEQLKDIPQENILCEPIGRNTAPCIGLGTMYILKKYGEDTVMIVLAADHMIKNDDIFVETFENVCKCAYEGRHIVTIGIEPNYAEVGYGYIRYIKDKSENICNGYKVEKFVEKPSIETAKKYIYEGNYMWNSGMFVWRVSTILDNIKEYMPKLYEGLWRIYDSIDTNDIDEVILKEYMDFESISIDYGIMEKAKDIRIFKGIFGWDDVGSWLAVSRMKELDEYNNAISGNVVLHKTSNCIIESRDKLIATVGINDTVIIDTKDAILISDKSSLSDIKEVLKILKEKNGDKYL